MTTLNGQQALTQLWAATALDPSALERAQLPAGEAPLPSSFAIGALAQASIAASALMAAEFWRLHGGAAQTVSVELAHAAAEFRSERYLRVDGAPACGMPSPAPILAATVAGYASTPTFPTIATAFYGCWTAATTRTAWPPPCKTGRLSSSNRSRRRGLAATAMRSFDEWDRHPQGQAVAALPLLSIERIGDAPPLARPFAPRPCRAYARWT